jgi:CBS domain-containing protein
VGILALPCQGIFREENWRGRGRVIGLLSERDIVCAVANRGTTLFNDAVSVHMTTDTEDESIYAAMGKMTNEHSRHLPVFRDEKLVGVVSIGDMVKHQLGDAGIYCDRLSYL